MTTLAIDALANLDTLNAKVIFRAHLAAIGTSPTLIKTGENMIDWMEGIYGVTRGHTAVQAQLPSAYEKGCNE